MRPVSCYESLGYQAPSPPAPAYVPPPPVHYNYINGATAAPTYSNAAPYDVSLDVHTKPGPPYYAEPNLGSAHRLWHDSITANTQSSLSPSVHSNEHRSDHRADSNHGEKKKESDSTTEVNNAQISTTTTTTTTTPKPTIPEATEATNITPTPSALPSSTSSILTHEQIKNFAIKLDKHVENLDKFRELARKKLQNEMARTATSDEELGQFFDPNTLSSFNKRHLADNSQLQPNPYFTNFV